MKDKRIEEIVKKLEYIIGDINGYEPDGEINTLCQQAQREVNSLVGAIHSFAQQQVQEAVKQAYKDGARDVRDYAINELMKHAGTLRADIDIFTFDKIKALTQPQEGESNK